MEPCFINQKLIQYVIPNLLRRGRKEDRKKEGRKKGRRKKTLKISIQESYTQAIVLFPQSLFDVMDKKVQSVLKNQILLSHKYVF